MRKLLVKPAIIPSMAREAHPPAPGAADRLQSGHVPPDPDLLGSVRRRAAFLFGGAPQVVVSAPGRIEIVGNHLDYNGGEVIAAAIDRWLVLAARGRTDGVLTLSAGDIPRGFGTFTVAAAREFDQRGGLSVRAWSDYGLAAVAALRAAGTECAGADLHYRGTIPEGVGLSSSAALLVAMVAALARLGGANLSPLDIARVAQDAEHRAGAPVGLLDQTSAVVGGMLRFSNDPARVSQIEANLGDAVFAVCDSGVHHSIPGSRYSTRVAECADALQRLRTAGFPIASLADLPKADLELARRILPAPLDARVQHVVEEVARTALAEQAIAAGDREVLGTLMNASGESSARLYDISHPAVERVVATARATPGVYGARMMGGGDGGSALVLLRREAVASLRQRLGERAVIICRIARGLVVEG
jgi:galactokinase